MKRLHGSYGAANPSLEAEKDALRKRMRVLRRQLAKAHPSAAVHLSLRRSAGVPPALRRSVVAGYRPQGSELDPQLLIEEFIREGWSAALPRTSDRETLLTFHAIGGELTPDAFGIPAPPPTAPRLIPDLLLIPLLAFDRSGGRLGQGAGCYDRTLAALRAQGPVRVIGLAYAGQEVDRVPTGDHDQRLDGILTDTGFIEVIDPRP